MTQVDKLRIYFVLSKDNATEDDYSSEMKLVSQIVAKYGGYTEWMTPSECISHEPQDKDVFVFDKFEGKAFERMKQSSSKYVVLGSRCLLTCITNGRPIPPNPYPMFTEGMRDLCITSSGFDQATKKQIQEKVQYMSGYYDNSLRSIITHLVAKNNISSKAIQAYKNNIKIMKLSWIEDVWQESLENNVNGNDQIFNKHISPLFNNLHITTSGIPKKEKDALRDLIENNGGNFMGTLEGNVTNIVLLTKPEGEKYKFAKSWNITCVKPLWIYDCIDAKAILPFKQYTIDSGKPKSSTPNKENCTANFSANFTANLSVINNPSCEQNKYITHLDETKATLSGKSDFQTPKVLTNPEQLRVVNKNIKSYSSRVIDNLFKNLKDCRLCIDGLNIFLHGFQSDDVEKLKVILNKGGAARFNEISEAVTHVIAEKGDDDLSGLAKYGAFVLSIDWLVESMKLKCPANEKKYLLVNTVTKRSEPPSPMSKHGAQLLSQNDGMSSQSPPRVPEENVSAKQSQVDQLLCKYSFSQPDGGLDHPGLTPVPPAADVATTSVPVGPVPTAPSSGTSKTDASVSRTSEYTVDEFFAGLTFFLSKELSEEELKYSEDVITERRGHIVGKRDLGVPDYAVVPVIGASLSEVTAKEVVNIYFLKDCCAEGCLLSPRYYHQPVACVKNSFPLKNCVLSVSNYIHGEREFMEMMIETLGGIAQSLLARKAKGGALKSTHLICAEAQGQKYEGAVRWGLPVVHHNWLLKCASLGIRVSEKPYLVGESKLTEPSESKTLTEANYSKVSKTTSATQMTDTTSNKGRSNDTNSVNTGPPPAETRYPEGFDVQCKKTPVHSAIARVKATETPKNSNSPDPNRTVTPTSPYGAFYGKGSPTPETRKRFWKWMNQGAEFPLDPPTTLLENKEETPPSDLISRHLEMLKRKPEELPPDSPVAVPFKKLNLVSSEAEEKEEREMEESEKRESLLSALEKMKKIEENFAKNGIKSPSSVKKKTESEGRHMVVVTESQVHTEVGWEDPVEKEVALRNLEKAAAEEVKPKVYMFSCLNDNLEEAKTIVAQRGGVVSSLFHFDSTATHLIAGGLVRAEKLMGSIAAGIWVLHPSYLEALRKAKSVYDVPETDYEWGGPKLKPQIKDLTDSSMKDFADCSYMWRLAVSTGQPRPFMGMKILLHLFPPKFESFKRLIEAGGGVVVTGEPPNYHQVDANYCVYEANSEKINFGSLARQNIKCVALFFIVDVLFRKKDAVERNLVPDFAQYWNDM